MKLLATLALLCVPAFSQNTACHSPAGASQALVHVTTTSATTLVPSVAGQDVHVCLIEFTGAPAATVTFQGSDGTALAIDTLSAAGTSYFVWWDGQLDTRPAAAGSSFQVVFSATPSIWIKVIYYLSPANSVRQ